MAWAAVALGIAADAAAASAAGAPRAAVDGPGRTARRIEIVARTRTESGLEAKLGDPVKLSARMLLASGRTVAVDDHVDWSSSDPSVLRISDGRDGNPAGLATPLKPGSVGVTVTYPSLRGTPPPFPAELPLGDAVTVVVRP